MAAAENIRKAGGSPGLACAGGHDKQVLSEAEAELFTDSADGFFLVDAVGNRVIYRYFQQILPLCSAVHQLLKIILAENAADPALRAGLVIPEICLEPVGGKHHGTAAKLPFQTVGVQNRLLPTNVRVLAGTLCLDYRQGQTVFAEQDIIAVAKLPDHPGHALDLVLLLHISIHACEFPAHLLEVHINIYFPSLEF